MTSAQIQTTTDPWARAHRSVVVGVDGSEGSDSALRWAAHEAATVGSRLRVVTATGRHHARAQSDLERATSRIHGQDVVTAVYDGRAEDMLVHHLDDARLLVVGKRGHGVIPRLLVGSVAVAVAGRSPVPVTVVPGGWQQEEHTQLPIVVGLDPDRAHHRLLHLAFRRAERLVVPLVLVHGQESHDSADVGSRFDSEVTLWSERFPDVEVRSILTPQHPTMALLAEAEKGAQLLALGRRVTHRFEGFGFGSVTRAVLHYAEVPVLVVPVDDDV
ncbi:universal stress protein [Nocardioides iriomotensis]|uniref:universal stress protein n=1 Tax=Nocardioides iriomotensis TaxID=715784 RepID=UPI0013ED29FB|nr:universal stress protein [Nocardioides iriomotensis]